MLFGGFFFSKIVGALWAKHILLSLPIPCVAEQKSYFLSILQGCEILKLPMLPCDHVAGDVVYC